MSDLGKVEIAIERAGNPDLSGLDASVFAIDGDGIGLLARLEVERDVVEQAALVAFDGEVVMRLPVLDR